MPTDSDVKAADGALEVRDDGTYALRFERRLAHPPEKVWRAITEPDQLRHWFPTDIEGQRELGARIRFVFRDDAPKAADMPEVLARDPEDMDGEITEFDPPRLLAFTWGEEALRFELRLDEPGCVLAFTHTFTEPGNVPHPEGPRKKGARDAAGWTVCLNALEAVVDGRQVEWSPDETSPRVEAEPGEDRWAQLYQGYVNRFG